MKKFSYFIGGAIIIGAMIFAIIWGLSSVKNQSLSLPFGQSFSVATSSLTGTTASTSPTYLAAYGTTTTAVFDISGSNALDISLQYNASSSTSTLAWIYEFSDNSNDWYMEDAVSTSGATVTHSSTATSSDLMINSWTPETGNGVNSAVGKRIPSKKLVHLSNVNAEYMRITFSSWNAGGAIWGIVKMYKPL